jgi:hypothetical protein
LRLKRSTRYAGIRGFATAGAGDPKSRHEDFKRVLEAQWAAYETEPWWPLVRACFDRPYILAAERDKALEADTNRIVVERE